uniref:GDNF/GAS1 domain-containing protein n=1 Tax=Stegastes partitus TaxID=144197 RepID=A0A3B4ZPJ1_9TELE
MTLESLYYDCEFDTSAYTSIQTAFTRETIRAAGTQETPVAQTRPYTLMENPVFLPPSCACVIQDEGCQIKGSEVCNMTIQTILDQFPSLQGCVCAQEEDLCDSIQVLASQCRRKPGAVFSVVSKISSYRWNYIFCLPKAIRCVTAVDAVCNRHLVPVLQACTKGQCDSQRCQQATQQFYGNMPQNVAEMLVMCECEPSDQSCLQMKTGLQSGTCGDETWICQETFYQCQFVYNDQLCICDRQSSKTVQEEHCCAQLLHQMDPVLMQGTDSECKMAFLATIGTTLHHPCTCKGVHNDELLTCNIIHDVFHNRSCFSELGSVHCGKMLLVPLNLLMSMILNKHGHMVSLHFKFSPSYCCQHDSNSFQFIKTVAYVLSFQIICCMLLQQCYFLELLYYCLWLLSVKYGK